MSYWNTVAQLKKEPLHERKANAAEFGSAMKTSPDLVGERVGWLLDGNYGKEEMDASHRILAMNANANKVASLCHMIAALEWRCPPEMAVAQWKKLSVAEKAKLDAAIKAEIHNYQTNRGE